MSLTLQCNVTIVWTTYFNIEELYILKNVIFRDVTPFSSRKNWCFRGTYRLHHQSEKNPRPRNSAMLVTADVVPSSLILFTLMMEAKCSSETSVLTRAARCLIPQEGILHCLRCENPKPYTAVYMYFLLRWIFCFVWDSEYTTLFPEG
jgi:hypothetical protein